MKRFIYIVLFAFVGTTAWGASDAMAQVGPRSQRAPLDSAERIDRHLEMLDQRLELTDRQETQIRALLEAHAAEMRAWRENNAAATRDERREQMRVRADAHRQAVANILTEDQRQELEKLRAERRSERRDRRMNEHRPGRRNDMPGRQQRNRN